MKKRPNAAVKKKKGLQVAAMQKKQAKKPNPFESKKSGVRFETLGRKVKGATKNVVQAKQDAVVKVRSDWLVSLG